MTRLKPGDRVAVYMGGSKDYPPRRTISKVLEVTDAGLRVTAPSIFGGVEFFAHTKQCRKLVKKERRKFRLQVSNSRWSVIDTFGWYGHEGEIIDVIEVRRKK